jgi:uncharacterized protein (TIGR03437 family)
MARAGINTVRVYGRIAAGDTAFWQAVESSDLYVLAAFPLDPYSDPRATLAPGSDLRARILRDFREYAAQLQATRRVVAVVFGNEVTRDYAGKFAGTARDFYSLVQEAAVSVRPLLVTTAVAGPADLARDTDLPDLAFWSVHQFSTGQVRERTAKPVLVAEFGVDAFDAVRLIEDPEEQAAALRTQLRLLRQEPVLGGVLFEWTDEWWRGGWEPSRHTPDDRAWFGLFGLLATDVPGLDALRPRPAFTVVAEEWGGKLPPGWPAFEAPRLAPGGVVNAGSLAPLLAPGGLLSLFGEELVETSFPELTSVCVGSRPVPLLLADPRQINGLLPSQTPLGPAPALVYRAGAASNVVSVEVREAAPGILDRGVLESGKPCPVSVASGVRPGAYLEIYSTGLNGPAPRCFLGSRELPVLYSGPIPGVGGLYQTNVRLPADFPPSSPVGLRLFASGVESNAYRISVLAESDRAGLAMAPEALRFVVQAGGPPRSAELAIDGRNGFCELVRFQTAGLPEGVTVSVPVGFPGRRVPVTVQASAQARGSQDLEATLLAVSTLPEAPAARLQISILPSRGDIAFRVLSGGGRAGLLARFEMAGRLLHEARGGGPGRGFNFVVLNGDTGILGPTRSFDTWLSQRAAEEMADYLQALPSGTIVLGAIADEGTLHLTPRARTALREILRSQLLDSLQYQDSWAIMTRVGAVRPIAEGSSRDQQVVLERVLSF